MKQHEGWFSEKAFLIIILQIALIVRVFLLDNTPFASDEAIYTYTSYLISRSVTPYTQMFVAHPPLNFYIIAFLLRVFEPIYPSVRLLNVCIYLVSIVFTFFLSKVTLANLNGKYSLLATALYAFYPSWFTLNSIASSLENLLTLFALLTVFFYMLYHRRKRNRYMLISGFFGACALLTTVRAIFFLASLGTFHLIYAVYARKMNNFVRSGAAFTLGFAVPTTFTLALLAISNALPNFFLNVFTYQYSLFRMSMNDRMWYMWQYLASQWPLLLLSGSSIPLAVRAIKENKDVIMVVPGFLFFYSFFFFSLFGFLMHYLQFLSPFLAILSALGIVEVRKRIKRRNRTKAIVLAVLVVLGFFGYVGATSFYSVYFNVQKNPYDKVTYYIGKRIANMTNPNDYIWSGDASIGFFSKRIIVAPSSDFRFVGCSDSVIGFDFGRDRGAEMTAYKDGFVTVEDFVQSWESNKVKVLVFIMKKGWIPYVDPFLWNGYREHIGARDYVISKYELKEVVVGEDVPYIYYIWVRRG